MWTVHLLSACIGNLLSSRRWENSQEVKYQRCRQSGRRSGQRDGGCRSCSRIKHFHGFHRYLRRSESKRRGESEVYFAFTRHRNKTRQWWRHRCLDISFVELNAPFHSYLCELLLTLMVERKWTILHLANRHTMWNQNKHGCLFRHL